MTAHTTGIKITILGSGTCVPSLKRSSCSVLMQTGSSRLLFDSGPGTMRRLLEAGTSIFDISHIFYSHFHPDHSGEFVPFIFATKYPDGSRRKTVLTVGGGRGFLDFYERLRSAYGSWIELAPNLLNMIEFDNKKSDYLQLEDFTVETAPAAHNEESIAYRITGADGSSAVYTGDTDYSETISDLAKNADLLICECALPDRLRVAGHLTPSLAGDLAARAEVRKLILTHFYPECEKADIEAECRKTYSGPLVLAEDLMEIELG
ncbi:MAG: ribonuclease Z [Desulfobacterales bacterium]|nr:ribonuclease Z [Desulfobacterales bacterium]